MFCFHVYGVSLCFGNSDAFENTQCSSTSCQAQEQKLNVRHANVIPFSNRNPYLSDMLLTNLICPDSNGLRSSPSESSQACKISLPLLQSFHRHTTYLHPRHPGTRPRSSCHCLSAVAGNWMVAILLKAEIERQG